MQVRPSCDGNLGNSVHSSFTKGGDALQPDRYDKWGLNYIKYVLRSYFSLTKYLYYHCVEHVFKFPYLL